MRSILYGALKVVVFAGLFVFAPAANRPGLADTHTDLIPVKQKKSAPAKSIEELRSRMETVLGTLFLTEVESGINLAMEAVNFGSFAHMLFGIQTRFEDLKELQKKDTPLDSTRVLTPFEQADLDEIIAFINSEKRQLIEQNPVAYRKHNQEVSESLAEYRKTELLRTTTAVDLEGLIARIETKLGRAVLDEVVSDIRTAIENKDARQLRMLGRPITTTYTEQLRKLYPDRPNTIDDLTESESREYRSFLGMLIFQAELYTPRDDHEGPPGFHALQQDARTPEARALLHAARLAREDRSYSDIENIIAIAKDFLTFSTAFPDFFDELLPGDMRRVAAGLEKILEVDRTFEEARKDRIDSGGQDVLKDVTVTDENGNGLAGISLVFQDAQGDTKTVQTDESGNAHIEVVPGTQVHVGGDKVKTESATISPDDEQKVEVQKKGIVIGIGVFPVDPDDRSETPPQIPIPNDDYGVRFTPEIEDLLRTRISEADQKLDDQSSFLPGYNWHIGSVEIPLDGSLLKNNEPFPLANITDDQWQAALDYAGEFGAIRVAAGSPKIANGIKNQTIMIQVEVGRTITAKVAQNNTIESPNDPFYSFEGTWSNEYHDQWAIRRAGFRPVGGDEPTAWPPAENALSAIPCVVAVIGSGIDLVHPDLLGSAWFNEKEIPFNETDDDGNGYIDDYVGWNFANGNGDLRDLNGHDTHVAGVIAARTGNGVGIAGINPWAAIMPLKVADLRGDANSVHVAEAVLYAVANGARVINISYGGPDSPLTNAAIQQATRNGVLVVVAAGNEGEDVTSHGPANADGALTVAATDVDGKRTKFSNWGQPIDIAAPGMDVLGLRANRTDFLLYLSDHNPDYVAGTAVVGKQKDYYRASGTSFSTPIVTGTASLIYSLRPELTVEQVRRMILMTAEDINEPGWDQYTGAGLLNAASAVKADPDYYHYVRIASVAAARRNEQVFVDVSGIAEGSEFSGRWLQIGFGKEPKEWITIAHNDKPSTDGHLGSIPASSFNQRGQWTIRVLTRDGRDSVKQARAVLDLK